MNQPSTVFTRTALCSQTFANILICKVLLVNQAFDLEISTSYSGVLNGLNIQYKLGNIEKIIYPIRNNIVMHSDIFLVQLSLDNVLVFCFI